MADWLRNIWSSLGPISLLQQDHLQQVVQDHDLMAFEHLQGEMAPVPVLPLRSVMDGSMTL